MKFATDADYTDEGSCYASRTEYQRRSEVRRKIISCKLSAGEAIKFNNLSVSELPPLDDTQLHVKCT